MATTIGVIYCTECTQLRGTRINSTTIAFLCPGHNHRHSAHIYYTVAVKLVFEIDACPSIIQRRCWQNVVKDLPELHHRVCARRIRIFPFDSGVVHVIRLVVYGLLYILLYIYYIRFRNCKEYLGGRFELLQSRVDWEPFSQQSLQISHDL